MSLAFAAFPRDVLCMQSLSLHCYFIPNYHTLFCHHWNQLVTHCRIKTQHLQKFPFSPHHPHALSQPPPNIPRWNPSPQLTALNTKCLCCSSHKRLPIVNHTSAHVKMSMSDHVTSAQSRMAVNMKLEFDVFFKWALFLIQSGSAFDVRDWIVRTHFCATYFKLWHVPTNNKVVLQFNLKLYEYSFTN